MVVFALAGDSFLDVPIPISLNNAITKSLSVWTYFTWVATFFFGDFGASGSRGSLGSNSSSMLSSSRGGVGVLSLTLEF